MDIEEILQNGLAAFLPVYEDGNVTRVFTGNGEQILVRRTCKTVLRNLARFYGVDLSAVREYYGSSINKKQGVPIPMTANLLLIPVKVRKNPLGENDGTLGYVNFGEIKEVADGEAGKCHITFKCGKDLLVLVSQATMREYMKNARLVESLFLNRHFYGCEAAAVNSTWGNIQETGSKYTASTARIFPPEKVPPEDLSIEAEEKAPLLPRESFLQLNEVLLREYLLKLLIEIIHMQKNQAAKGENVIRK
jgi:hypothetical protein